MNQWRALILFFFIFFLSSPLSYAAGLIVRQQQMKAMKQQQMQMEAMREEQAYLQYQQALLAQQKQQQQAPAPPTYQQQLKSVIRRIAQAICRAQPIIRRCFIMEAAQPSPHPSRLQPSPRHETQDVVDLSEVWKKLDKKSTVWTLLMDNQAKVLTVPNILTVSKSRGLRLMNRRCIMCR